MHIDRHNVMIRWAITVSWWAYTVAGPNRLSHLDSHHSLVAWGFVIDVIDGFSRLVTFLHCSTNNRTGTVADLFLNATQEYGWPSWLRTDHGGGVFRCVAHIFYTTFQAMEERGLLEIDNPLHKFAPHYVYLPHLNRTLSSSALA